MRSSQRLVAPALAVAALAFALVACGSSSLDRLVLDEDGTVDASFAAFQPQGPWTLTYHWDCSSQRSRGVQSADSFLVTVYNTDDLSLVSSNPVISKTGLKGSGSVSYRRQGSFLVKLSTACTWRVTVNRAT